MSIVGHSSSQWTLEEAHEIVGPQVRKTPTEPMISTVHVHFVKRMGLVNLAVIRVQNTGINLAKRRRCVPLCLTKADDLWTIQQCTCLNHSLIMANCPVQ